MDHDTWPREIGDPDGPPIVIRMNGEQGVIRPVPYIGADATEVVAAALNAAVEAGSVVLVELAS